MKTILLSIGLAAAFSSAAFAQSMTVPVPGNSQSSNQGSQNGNGGSFWQCGSTTTGPISTSGNGNAIYADRSTVVNVDGNNNTIYSVSTGAITVNGNNNQIYADAASRITVHGNNNMVHAPENMTVTFDGNNNDRMSLSNLTFDYSTAPTSGTCATVTGVVQNVTEDKEVALIPNPARAGQILTLASEKTPDGNVVLTDMQGRVVRSYEAGSQQLSLRNVPSGYYMVKFSVNEAPVAMPVVVQ